MATFTDWEVVDDGSFNGVRKLMRSSDEDEGTVQVRYEGYDVPIILDRNKRAQNDHTGGRMGEMVHAAHIPASVLLQWFHEDGIMATQNPEYMKRKLNDPSWKYLKRLPIQL